MKIKSSWVIAAGIAAVAVAWILSGILGGEDGAEVAVSPADRIRAEAAEPTRVRTQVLQAGKVQRVLSVYGRTRPNRDVTVRAETGGRVEEIIVAKGAHVDKGQLLVRLAMNDRAARRLDAAATVDRRRLEFDQARSLQRSDFASRTRVAEARAALETARAELARIDQEIDDVTIEAPFAGVFDENLVDEGSYVAVGDDVAHLIEMDPMRVVGEVSERDVDFLAPGIQGTVRLVDGREVPGTVTWVASSATQTTRTYRVEMTVPNPDGAIAGGMTADLRVPLRTVPAHLVSPAVLTLNDAGVLGVKTVDADKRVEFHPVELVADEPEGVWLAGLPETVEVITVGQEYVRQGDLVEPVRQAGDGVVSPSSAGTASPGAVPEAAAMGAPAAETGATETGATETGATETGK